MAREVIVVGGKVVTEVAKPATCTEAGETAYTATFENAAFPRQQVTLADIPPLGHEWGEWVVVTPATETEAGLEQRTCARCGKEETRDIPAVVAYHYVGPDRPS